MKIKINIDTNRNESPETIKNTAAITAALAKINGKADAHTYTWSGSVTRLAREAEAELEAAKLPKKHRAGASYVSESGSKLPAAYKREAITTVVTLHRGSADWYLVDVRRAGLWPGRTPSSSLVLTDKQDALAIYALRTWMRKPSTIVQTIVI